MHNHSYENEAPNLHVDEDSFSCESMDTETHFEKEAKGILERAPLRDNRKSAQVDHVYCQVFSQTTAKWLLSINTTV